MRTALITGASRGIGRGVALDLAARGFGLTVTSRREADLAALTAELLAVGSPSVVCRAADLENRESLPAVVQLHADTFDTMDALVLSGGIGTGGPLISIPTTRVDKTVTVNMTSAITLLQEALPLLRRAGAVSPYGARVVMLSSITGIYAEPGLAVYGATKAALASLAETLNAEESGNGVMATAVAPAFVDTDMAAYATDTVPTDAMIPVADVAAIVGMVVGLARSTSIVRIVVSRSGTTGYVA